VAISDAVRARNEIVMGVAKERKISVIEASRAVKAEGLYKPPHLLHKQNTIMDASVIVAQRPQERDSRVFRFQDHVHDLGNVVRHDNVLHASRAP
jgi:hypothetical protein